MTIKKTGGAIKKLNNLSKLNKLNDLNNLTKESLNGNNISLNSGKGANNIRNNLRQSSSSSKGSSNGVIIVAVILLLIIVGVCVFLVYKYLSQKKKLGVKDKQLISYIHDASMEKRFNFGSLPVSAQGNEYNLNLWVYINDYQTIKEGNGDVCIIYKGTGDGNFNSSKSNAEGVIDINKNGNPGIWLLKEVNTLRINVGLETNYNNNNNCVTSASSCADNSGTNYNSCDIKNFPLQKWVNLNVSLRNSSLDVFLNGELHKSCILPGAPIMNNGDLYVCKSKESHGGFNGYISNFVYTNKALSADSIYNTYKKGPVLNIKSRILNIFS